MRISLVNARIDVFSNSSLARIPKHSDFVTKQQKNHEIS
jgi:hypothetical protein